MSGLEKDWPDIEVPEGEVVRCPECDSDAICRAYGGRGACECAECGTCFDVIPIKPPPEER